MKAANGQQRNAYPRANTETFHNGEHENGPRTQLPRDAPPQPTPSSAYLVQALRVCGGGAGMAQHGELVLVVPGHAETRGQAVTAVALWQRQAQHGEMDQNCS
jgi:hypothetical protein